MSIESENNPRELLEIVRRLEVRIENLEREIAELKGATRPIRDQSLRYRLGVADLLELPDHLRKTMIAVAETEQATAQELTEKTGRVRNLESSYLNQLERMGLIERFRKGRKVYFRARYVRGPGVRRVLEELSKR